MTRCTWKDESEWLLIHPFDSIFGFRWDKHPQTLLT